MIDPKKFGSKAITILPGSIIRVVMNDGEVDIKLAEEITVRGGKITQHFLIKGQIIEERDKEKDGKEEKDR